MDTLPHEHSDLEGDSLTYWKRVETVELVTYGHSVQCLHRGTVDIGIYNLRVGGRFRSFPP